MQFLWYKKGTSIQKSDGGALRTQRDFEFVFSKYGDEMRYVLIKDGCYLIIDPIPDNRYKIFAIEDGVWTEVLAFDERYQKHSNHLTYEDMLKVLVHYAENDLLAWNPDFEWNPSPVEPDILVEIEHFENNQGIIN